MDFESVIKFWFEETPTSKWFEKDSDFDELLQSRFLAIHSQAVQGELFSWRSQALGRLAEIIVIDQFSRNLFREKPESFAYDSLALVLAQEAIAVGAQSALSTVQKSFLYMPYMHSESSLIHEEAVKLFSEPGLENNLKFEYMHKKIIDRFGRYPHRNKALGRTSTQEELEFLKQPDSSF